MKKLFTAIFILLCSVVFGQNGTPLYPITQNIGSTSALLDIKGGARVGGAFVLGHYADTTAANAVPYVKNFANGLITTDTNLLWIRSYNAQQWYFVPNTGNPATGDTLYWRVGGNALIPMQQQGIYTGLGSKDSTPLFFITNYQRRLVIPPNGVNRSAGTANKCLVIDTVTKFMYYTDCGSGGGTTYTSSNGITLTGSNFKLGGTLVDATTTVDADEKNILINNTDVFQVLSSPPGYDSYARLKMSGAFDGDGILLSQTNEGGDDSTYLKVGLSGVQVGTGTGNYFYVKNLNYTLSTTGKKIMLRDTATGLVQNIDPALLGGSTAISALTAATGTNSINNAGYNQTWEWNSIAGSTALIISSTSTSATGNAQSLFDVELSGVNSNSNQSTHAANIINSHTGTGAINIGLETQAKDAPGQNISITAAATGGASSTNIGIVSGASGGANNYAIIVPASEGSVGIGTSTPAKIFHTVGTVRHEILGTASGDTTTNKPVGINSSGDIIPMTYWPGGGGGWGTTGTVATLTGASTLSMGTNNFTFASTGDANLMKIDAVNNRINISNSGIALGVLTVGGDTWINGSYLAVNDGSNQSTLGSTYLSLYNSFGTPEIRNASGHFQISPIAGYSTVINDNGVDADFRVEGDNDANLIFADAGNDKVGIGTASPTTKLHIAGRFAANQGADVASAAGAIALGTDGNTFEITGTAAITLISKVGWVNGAEINLIFTSTATLTDGTANSGNDIGMELAGNANFTASADDVVTLILTEIGGTQRWREKSRSVN